MEVIIIYKKGNMYFSCNNDRSHSTQLAKCQFFLFKKRKNDFFVYISCFIRRTTKSSKIKILEEIILYKMMYSYIIRITVLNYYTAFNISIYKKCTMGNTIVLISLVLCKG